MDISLTIIMLLALVAFSSRKNVLTMVSISSLVFMIEQILTADQTVLTALYALVYVGIAIISAATALNEGR